MIGVFIGVLLSASDAVVSDVKVERYEPMPLSAQPVNRRHSEMDLIEPIIIPSVVDEQYTPKERWVTEGNLSWDEYSDRIRFRMRNGRLLPQIRELASHLKGAAVVPGDHSWFQWTVSPNFEWPNSVELEEQSVEHLMDRLMLSYNLNLNVMKNGVVLIHE